MKVIGRLIKKRPRLSVTVFIRPPAGCTRIGGATMPLLTLTRIVLSLAPGLSSLRTEVQPLEWLPRWVGCLKMVVRRGLWLESCEERSPSAALRDEDSQKLDIPLLAHFLFFSLSAFPAKCRPETGRRRPRVKQMRRKTQLCFHFSPSGGHSC